MCQNFLRIINIEDYSIKIGKKSVYDIETKFVDSLTSFDCGKYQIKYYFWINNYTLWKSYNATEENDC